jgi:NDP-sugar pyrophosphorylase family protein
MLHIVIPMAGAGSRFAVAGYTDPKPLIPVHGVPMIRVVIENLRPSVPHRFVFIAQRAHLQAYGLEPRLAEWAPGSVVRGIDGVTAGAACTVLTARDLIDSGDPLLIANADQYVDVSMDEFLRAASRPGVDGLVMTMRADDPKWSFAGLRPDGSVERIVEKQVISNEATVGIYHFARGADFVRAADAMIARDERVNGEFYVAPVYNGLIAGGRRIAVLNVGRVGDGMYGLGTPADLEDFLRRPVSRQRAGARP